MSKYNLFPLRQYLFPARVCPSCGTIVNDAGLCYRCRETMKRLTRCKKCAAFILEGEEFCNFCCKNITLPFSEAKAAFPYAGYLRYSILQFKYYNKTNLARPLSIVLKELIKSGSMNDHFDLIVPVPLAEQRLKSRGYNQCEILSEFLSKQISIPCMPGALKKTVETPPLSSLSRKERTRILKNVFIAEKTLVKGKQILLVDDIFTTGATAIACAGALQKGGAKDIKVVTVAAGKQ